MPVVTVAPHCLDSVGMWAPWTWDALAYQAVLCRHSTHCTCVGYSNMCMQHSCVNALLCKAEPDVCAAFTMACFAVAGSFPIVVTLPVQRLSPATAASSPYASAHTHIDTLCFTPLAQEHAGTVKPCLCCAALPGWGLA